MGFTRGSLIGATLGTVLAFTQAAFAHDTPYGSPAASTDAGPTVILGYGQPITLKQFLAPLPGRAGSTKGAVQLASYSLRDPSGNVVVIGDGGAACYTRQVRHSTTGWGFSGSGTIVQETRWCDDGYSFITNVQSTSWAEYNGFCGPNGSVQDWIAGGGVNQTSVDVRSQGGFTCSIDGFSYNEFVWETPRFYPGGGWGMAGHH